MLFFFKKKGKKKNKKEPISQNCQSKSSASSYILPDIPGIQNFVFKLKSETFLTFLTSTGIIFPISGAKYLNERKPWLLVYIAPREKSVSERRLYSVSHKSNNSDVV